MNEHPVCDFCTSPDVQWRYRSEDSSHDLLALHPTERPVIVHHSLHGDWAACPACHALIERGDRKRLAKRSARRLYRKHGDIPYAVCLVSVTAVQDQFFAHRVGDPIPIERKAT